MVEKVDCQQSVILRIVTRPANHASKKQFSRALRGSLALLTFTIPMKNKGVSEVYRIRHILSTMNITMIERFSIKKNNQSNYFDQSQKT